MQNTGYDIEVEAKDVVGNVGKGNLLNQITEEVTSGLVEGAIKFTNPSWTNGTASIQVSTNTGYKIEYQLNGTEGQWTEIANNGTINNLAHNTNVYARLTDGINSGEYATASIKDTVAPTVYINTSNITSNSVRLNVTATDSQSGLASSNAYSYYLNDSLIVSNNANYYDFTGLAVNTNYTLKVTVTDKAGLVTEKTINVKTKNELITFKMGEEYTAEKGMTWREWVESEYNTCGLLITKYDLVAYDYEFGGNMGFPEPGNVIVYADDVIDENLDYDDGYGYVLYHRNISVVL